MPSRLSSLLVRDGLVGVKRMEKAFQRQVIYGGSLDTILLEMSLVPEERLAQYLALASGLPPAARDEGSTPDAAATEIIPRVLAEQYRAVPVAIEGEAVRVLVCAPLEISELEDLADRVDRPLQPLITPEYRWHLAYATAFGLDPPARFTTLARALDVDPTGPPVGRARTVIIDDRAPIAPIEEADETLKFLTPDPPVAPVPESDRPEDSGRQRRHTLIGVNVTRAITEALPVAPPPEPPPVVARTRSAQRMPVLSRTATDRGSGPPAAPPVHAEEPYVPKQATPPEEHISDRGMPPLPKPDEVSPPTPVARAAEPTAKGTGVSVPLPSGVAAPVSAASRRPSAPIPTEGRDSPLPIVRARELLAVAEDRDTVFLTLLRAARSRARWAGVLTVQGGAAIGRVALAEPELDTRAVSTILIPLDTVSPFRAVVTNHQPHIGPLSTGDAAIDAMVQRMGGAMPPSGLVLPIVLRDRVVALVVAHRQYSDLRLADVTELLPIAIAASEALGRLIVKHKSAGYRSPTGALEAIAEPLGEQIETKRITRPEVSERGPDTEKWTAPPRPQTPPTIRFEQGTELSLEADPPRPIDELLGAVEAVPEAHAEDALSECVERAAETLAALGRRFPGKLRVDRFAVAGRPLRAAQYGGLLELVVRLGSIAADLLVEKMDAPARDTRYYATLCTAELRPRTAVYALAERLFDQDFGVRALAIEALSGYPMADLGHALVRARRAVHASDPEIVAAAANALVALGDTEAVPDFIGALERNDRGAEHGRKALVALTAQDFGGSERKWRKWYDGAKKRHRIEWLLEGLSHKDDAIRESAIATLRRLTGEYFGYHHDLPRRDREHAAELWAGWWRDSGQHRFLSQEDERNRPTALLPSRDPPK